MKTPRIITLITLVVITPLGFASKFYRGPGDWWFNNYAGGMLYEIFWMLLVVLVRPGVDPVYVALGVFTGTALLEVLQLWHPPFLEAIRSTFLGRTLIGTSFSRWDFVYYIVGCTIGWGWLRYVRVILSP
ncbi:MAG: DUF2809 domain-containing protein [Candidatus Latescibacteria bacterium]|nr:DUF2809 domain-containing protein [Candidatus Latescibacterota bacterium]